jgi:hypothetical protein
MIEKENIVDLRQNLLENKDLEWNS